jgi:aminopeptidase N
VKENVRLPRSLKPLAYDLKLIPFMFDKNFTFDGEVTILFEVLDECDNITLHAESLRILDDNVEVYLHQNTTNQTLRDSAKVGKKKQYFVESKQFYVIEVSQKLKKGSVYELMIRFTGVLNDFLQGFYRSSYSDGKNVR